MAFLGKLLVQLPTVTFPILETRVYMFKTSQTELLYLLRQIISALDVTDNMFEQLETELSFQ